MNARSVLATLLLGLGAAGCSAPSVWILPRVSLTEVDGDVASVQNQPGGAVIGATTSLQDDLNLDDSNAEFAPRVDLLFGGHLSLSTLGSSFRGEGGVVNADFDTGTGDTIDAGVAVDTDLDLTATNATITWDFVPGDVEAGLGLGVSLIDFDLRLDDNAGNVVQTDDVDDIPVPMLAARFGIDKERFQVGALVAGLKVDSDLIDTDDEEEFDLSAFDFDVHAAYKLLSGPKVRGLVVVGFRQFRFDIEGSDAENVFEFDLDFGGPYFGVNIVL